jgi:PAP_fibrillin
MMSATILLLLFLLSSILFTEALQNLIPKQFQDMLPTSGAPRDTSSAAPTLTFPNPFSGINQSSNKNNANVAKQLEQQLLEAIQDLGNNQRLANSETIDNLVAQLEAIPTSIAQPAISPQIYGRWRLLHTTNANTASPIQRKAVSSSAVFAIYQDIILRQQQQQRDDNNNNKNDNNTVLIVSQVVQFSDSLELKVDALASTSAYPLPELTARQGDGKILGFNLLGVSKIGDDAKPQSPDSRIDFVFDEGNFEFELLGSNTLKIPYPVPFRLPILRDAVKGWIDITYLSDTLRISRGNKGTTFILQKEKEQ